jgi:DNA (cytosine-5)-methyltransferase 1
VKGATLFSGIGAPEQSAPWVDWRWCAEYEPPRKSGDRPPPQFAAAVHAARHGTPNHGNVEEIDASVVEPADLVVLGPPCQSFSVAGKRLGLDDPRGNLALVGLRLVSQVRPRWVVFENVPGLLSSDGGRDFGTLLRLLGNLGYGFAYRVLDAQYFGVPQRRRRIFVVGHLGDWRPAAAVLFERASLRGDTPPSRAAGQGVARPIAGCAEGGSGWRGDADTADNLIVPPITSNPYGDHESREGLLTIAAPLTRGADSAGKGGYAGRRQEDDVNLVVAPTLTGGSLTERNHGKRSGSDRDPLVVADTVRVRAGSNSLGAIAFNWQDDRAFHAGDSPNPLRANQTEAVLAHSLRADGFDASEDGTGRGTPIVIQNPQRGQDQNGLGVGDGPMFTLDGASQHAVAFHENQRAETTLNDTAGSLKIGGGKPGQGYPALAQGMSVRRLTPVECERLQGFPDVKKSVTILVCPSDRIKNAALAEISKLNGQNSVSSVDASESGQSVNPAEGAFSISLLGRDWPVAVNARIDYERTEVELRSQGRLLWSARHAEKQRWSHPSMQPADFARLAAPMMEIREQITRSGRAESLQSDLHSFLNWNGLSCAVLSGSEISELASDAEKYTTVASALLKSITSEVGLSFQNFEQNYQTWCCCVAAAISGFIPEQIRGENLYALRVEGTAGFTSITFRGKPASDGNRYRVLGNSMAVPVIRWILDRIRMVDGMF